jgi:hypothetical protein
MQITLNEQDSLEWLEYRKQPKEPLPLPKDTIIRTVKVNRNRTAREAIEATGRKFYGDRVVVDTMPGGKATEVELHIFKLDLSKRGGWISDDDLEKEFDLRGLKPVDPFALAALNEADPAFADEKPNATHWKDVQGDWCYAIFRRWGGERVVSVRRCDGDWDDYSWFASVRK